MRMLIAIAFGFALVLGVTQASSGATEPELQPASELSTPAVEQAPVVEQAIEDTAEPTPELDNETGYECKYSPYCQRASQCEAYCAGGIPACVRGCCACAS